MGLSGFLARAAARRLHVLLVEGDDAFVLRVAAERACLARGWVLSLSPAEADVLLSCRPRPTVVGDAADAVFEQLPGPRARAELWHERHLEAVLDQLHASYLRWPSVTEPARIADTRPEVGDRLQAGSSPQPDALRDHDPSGHLTGTDVHLEPSKRPPTGDDHSVAETKQQTLDTARPGVGSVRDLQSSPWPEHEVHTGIGMDHARKQARDDVQRKPTQLGQDDVTGHDMHGTHGTHNVDDDATGHAAHGGDDAASEHDMHEHGIHGMHGMDMAGPGGIALASGARDRDGLEMDRLHVQLGPVLAWWPAGLVVWCTLAGDVVTQVDVVQPAFAQPQGAGGDLLVAVRLDAAAQLLGLAGAEPAARRVRAARDAVLVRGRRKANVARLVDPLPRLVERAALLRWSLRGLGVVSVSRAVEHGWPQDWIGDVHARLLHLLDPLAPLEAGLVEGGVVVEALPVLLRGLDVAAARLVVASLVAQTPNPAADHVVAPPRAVR